MYDDEIRYDLIGNMKTYTINNSKLVFQVFIIVKEDYFINLFT